MVKIFKLLKQNKEGIIIGAIIGWVVGKFFLPSDFDFSIVAQSQSIFDPLIESGKDTIELAKTKVTFATTLIGAGIGFVLDFFTTEGTFFKRRRR